MASNDDDSEPPLSCVDCALGHYTLYGPTRGAAPGEVYARRRGVARFAAGKTFLREGENPPVSYTLYSGWAFRFKQLPDGRRQILSFLVPGDTVVIEHLSFPEFNLPCSIRSLTAVVLCTFSLRDMVDLTQISPLQLKHFGMVMQLHVAGLQRRLVDLGQRSAIGRVAQLLLELEFRLRFRKLSSNGRFSFPVRQEHVADALGLTAVYVNRTLDRLRQQGVITFDRQYMTVLNFPELKRIADEE